MLARILTTRLGLLALLVLGVLVGLLFAIILVEIFKRWPLVGIAIIAAVTFLGMRFFAQMGREIATDVYNQSGRD